MCAGGYPTKQDQGPKIFFFEPTDFFLMPPTPIGEVSCSELVPTKLEARYREEAIREARERNRHGTICVAICKL
jgi:hypothetical protein